MYIVNYVYPILSDFDGRQFSEKPNTQIRVHR